MAQPTVLPTLNYRARPGITPGSPFSLTRATSGTRTNALRKTTTAGAGVLRHDYDQSKQYLGWLVETQAPNLLAWNDVGNVNWGAQNDSSFATTKTANYADTGGYSQACRVQANGGKPGMIHLGCTVTQAVPHTFTFFAKSANTNTYSGKILAYTFGGGSHSSSNVISITPTAQRFSLTFTPTAADIVTGPCDVQLRDLQIGGDVLVWDAQLEIGSVASALIPTNGGQATRNSDLITVPTSGFDFDPAEGTLLFIGDLSSVSGSPWIASIDDGTSGNNILIYASGGVPGGWINTGGVNQANITAGAITANTLCKVALAYRANDFAFCVNGGTVGTDTSGTVPTVNTLRLFGQGIGTPANGHVRQLAYWPMRLADAELQAITA